MYIWSSEVNSLHDRTQEGFGGGGEMRDNYWLILYDSFDGLSIGNCYLYLQPAEIEKGFYPLFWDEERTVILLVGHGQIDSTPIDSHKTLRCQWSRCNVTIIHFTYFAASFSFPSILIQSERDTVTIVVLENVVLSSDKNSNLFRNAFKRLWHLWIHRWMTALKMMQ